MDVDVVTDWRLPENRREAFQRHYSINLRYKCHPGLVYSQLPYLVAGADEPTLSWCVWLNGNTQNPVTTSLLLEASDYNPRYWHLAVNFWNEHFKELEWDTDRRHQKSKFGEATRLWATRSDGWLDHSKSWGHIWSYAMSLPYMGRLSAWSMTEYARILLGDSIPDAASLLLTDRSGSRSHRNGLAVVAGYDAAYWDEEPFLLGLVPQLEQLGEELLEEAERRNDGHPDVLRLTLESCLCTNKSMYKPNRRYPGVYADMNYLRILRGQQYFGNRFQVLWAARQTDLPEWMRIECGAPPMTPAKQNLFLETGRIPAFDYLEMM